MQVQAGVCMWHQKDDSTSVWQLFFVKQGARSLAESRKSAVWMSKWPTPCPPLV